MPTLELSFRDKSIGNYPLQKGTSLTIGRQKTNDIVIENLAVSSHHAKIDSVGDGFVLIDLKSKNGLFVNDKRVGSHWLKEGDIIRIGKHALAFGYSEGEDLPADQNEAIEKTMAMDTSQYRSMVKKNKTADKTEPDRVVTPVKSNSSDTIGILKYQSGGSGNHVFRRSITKIGKHPDSDIVVKGFMVGSTSATISRKPDGFHLSYVGGMSRPKVNAKKVSREILLNDCDIIEIGTCTLQFFERQPANPRKIKPKKNPIPPKSSPE